MSARPARGKAAGWLMLCPTCNVGQRGNCDCPEPAEAATSIDFEHEPAPSVISQRFRARAAAWLGALAVIALYAVNSEPPPEILAAPYLPGDGFPAELLADALPSAAASEARP